MTATNSQLIDAVNLICEHVEGRLPDDWEIRLILRSDEAYFELINPTGDEVEVETEMIISQLNSMIETAIENTNEKP